MIKIIILIQFVILTNTLYSQCVSVELSMDWKVNDGYIKEDTTCCTPYLNIAYRNNTTELIYFLKVSKSKNEIPDLMYHFGLGLDSLHMPSDVDYYGSIFYVVLDSWEILAPEERTNEHELNFINHDISEIHAYTSHSYYKNNQKLLQTVFFSDKQISSRHISDEVKDEFVFLKPGEVHVDSYNLFAFQLARGKYTFLFEDNFFKNSVNSIPKWDETKKQLLDMHLMLPKDVDGYKLYSGGFKTNELTIEF